MSSIFDRQLFESLWFRVHFDSRLLNLMALPRESNISLGRDFFARRILMTILIFLALLGVLYLLYRILDELPQMEVKLSEQQRDVAKIRELLESKFKDT